MSFWFYAFREAPRTLTSAENSSQIYASNSNASFFRFVLWSHALYENRPGLQIILETVSKYTNITECRQTSTAKEAEETKVLWGWPYRAFFFDTPELFTIRCSLKVLMWLFHHWKILSSNMTIFCMPILNSCWSRLAPKQTTPMSCKMSSNSSRMILTNQSWKPIFSCWAAWT